MSDETTLLLRKLLDERGVEYEAYRDIKNRCITKWRTYHGAFVFFAVEKEGKLFVETTSDTEHSAICTPEQAIAATLGAEYHGYEQAAIEAWESIKAWNTRATHGTLTAEQVEIAINNHCQFTVGCVVDAQAIADELNAKLEEKPRDRTEERLLNACDQATQDYVTQLELERDEKVSLLETAFERCRELEAERDELQRELDIANAKLAEYADRIRELMEVKEGGGLIADVLAPICVDEKERMAFERGRVHERLAQQIFKEATS